MSDAPRPALADLHVHVGRARGRPVKVAASPRLTVAGILDESVKRKGLDVVAVVDAQSPLVLEELEAMVSEGTLRPLPGGGLDWRGGRSLLLILASEVEVDEPDVGPVHYLCYLPDLETARGFSSFLEPRVRNVSLSSQTARTTGDELARWVGREGGFLVPAHVFTPHKGFFGQGGTDLRQALRDKALEAVPAVELGLSADTALADLVPSLGPFTYLTNSDAHSPETIAREHNALWLGQASADRDDSPPSTPAGRGRGGFAGDFRALARAVREGRVAANYGLDPRLGKYHRAFCPACGFISAEKTVAGRVCPACGRAGLVGGVLDRILTLAGGERPPRAAAADRDGARPRPPYVHVVPLRHVPGVGPETLRKLLEAFGTEMNVLHEVPERELVAVIGERLASRVCAARSGTADLDIAPGAGGRYGRVRPPGLGPGGRRGASAGALPAT